MSYGHLGERVEQEWRQEHDMPDAFPAIAQRCLDDVTLADLEAEWYVDHPTELQPKPRSGDPAKGPTTDPPPAIRYAGRGFVIEARTTLSEYQTIRDDEYRGAARVATGVGCRNRYKFTAHRRAAGGGGTALAPSYRVGTLMQEDVLELRPEDPAIINHGNRVRESYVALSAYPLVLIVIRLAGKIRSPLWYERPGIALRDPASLPLIRPMFPEQEIPFNLESKMDALRRGRWDVHADRDLPFFLTLLMTQQERRFIVYLAERHAGTPAVFDEIPRWIHELVQTWKILEDEPEPRLTSPSFMTRWCQMTQDEAVEYLLSHVKG